jgi:hypothetical protein
VADRGSITPIMMAVVAVSVGVSSVTARVGREQIETFHLETAADAVALALATGDHALGLAVAQNNQVLIVDWEISGNAASGFEARVTVGRFGADQWAEPGRQKYAQARASTKP